MHKFLRACNVICMYVMGTVVTMHLICKGLISLDAYPCFGFLRPDLSP